MKIALYGSNKSNWRNVILPFIPNKYEVILPRYAEVYRGLEIVNTKELDECDVYLHCITSKDFSVDCVINVIQSVRFNSFKTILIVRHLEEDISFSIEGKKEILNLVKRVDSFGGVCFYQDFSALGEYLRDFIPQESDNTENIIDSIYNNIKLKQPSLILEGKSKICTIQNTVNLLM